jgi:hypothetical protein
MTERTDVQNHLRQKQVLDPYRLSTNGTQSWMKLLLLLPVIRIFKINIGLRQNITITAQLWHELKKKDLPVPPLSKLRKTLTNQHP